MLTPLVITITAVETAALEVANIIMDSTTLLVTISGVSLTFMALMAGGIWRIIGLVNSTRTELSDDISTTSAEMRKDIGEVHSRIDILTDKYHAVDKEVAVLKEGSGRQGVQQ